MRIMRNVLIVLVAIVAIVIIGVALTCNGNDDGDDAGDPTAVSGTPVLNEDLGETADAIVVVLQDRDAEALRDYFGAALLADVDEGDLARVAGCIPEGATLSVPDRTPEVLGDQGSVIFEFEVTTAAGETADVAGVWNFEQDGDGWLLKELPSCPFDSL